MQPAPARLRRPGGHATGGLAVRSTLSCTLAPILCRAGPDYDASVRRRGLDQDLALLLLQGVSAVITRTTKIQLAGVRADHAARDLLRRRQVRAARPTVRRRDVHRVGRPRRSRAASSSAPRSPTAACRSAGSRTCACPTAASTSTSASTTATTRFRPTCRRRGEPVGHRRAVRRPAAADRPAGPTSRTARDRARTTPDADRRDPAAVDLDQLVNSVDKDDLRTVVDELGTAFQGTGPDLATIIDTSNSFIETAYANLGVTKELIKNSRVALQTQLDSESAIRSFAQEPAAVHDHARQERPGPAHRDRQGQTGGPSTSAR